MIVRSAYTLTLGGCDETNTIRSISRNFAIILEVCAPGKVFISSIIVADEGNIQRNETSLVILLPCKYRTYGYVAMMYTCLIK